MFETFGDAVKALTKEDVKYINEHRGNYLCDNIVSTYFMVKSCHADQCAQALFCGSVEDYKKAQKEGKLK